MWNPEQLSVLESSSPFKQVIAGAGSGKTRTMVGLVEKKREKYNLQQFQVVTFTKKATQEFLDRLLPGPNLPRVQTFHSFAYQMLLGHYPPWKNRTPRVATPEIKTNYLKEFLIKNKWRVGGYPFDFFTYESGKWFQEEFSELWVEWSILWRDIKRKENLCEFEDMLDLLESGLSETWSVSLKHETRQMIVDEYQDTNPKMNSILAKLQLEELTVVGDDWQAIYSFLGATPEPFLNFPLAFPGTEVLFLRTNYRSVEKIVRWSVTPLCKNKDKTEKELIPHRKEKGICRILSYPNFFSFFSQESPLISSLRMDSVVLVRSHYHAKVWQKMGFPKIQTIHSAKGLEWDKVIVDLLSPWRTNPEGDDREERRILYVALSRAKTELYVLGGGEEGLESVFFRELNRSCPRAILW